MAQRPVRWRRAFPFWSGCGQASCQVSSSHWQVVLDSALCLLQTE